jgi:hypothetical protein
MEVSGQLKASAALAPGKNPRTHWIEGWVGLRSSLDICGDDKIFLPLPVFETRTVQTVA